MNFDSVTPQKKYQDDQTDNGSVALLKQIQEGKTVYFVPHIDTLPSKLIYRWTKRMFDFCVSLIAIIILAIPMLIIAIIIRCDSKGPAIYRQERLGLNGEPYMLYKFRSMRLDAEKYGARWATAHDERITKIGGFLRDHRLDEFPQLFNIVIGQMSIVGPRPERQIFYDEFEQYIIGFSQRLQVMPGLTGLAQISGGYNLKPEEKIQFDVRYMKERSLWLDLKIILKTVLIVLNKNGAR